MLDTISSIITYTIILATSLAGLKYGYVSYHFAIRRRKIAQVKTQIASYRLRLKTKLRQRLGSHMPYGHSELKTALSDIMQGLSTLELEDPNDYKKVLFNIAQIKQVVGVEEIIKGIEHFKAAPGDLSIAPALQLLRKAYEDVFEFDKDVVLFIVEIHKLTENYHLLAAQYNRYTEQETQVKKIADLPPKIDIPAFHLLEDICNQYHADVALMRSLNHPVTEDSVYKKVV